MKRVAIPAIVLAALAGLAWLVVERIAAQPPEGTLYGNVEIRQVDLAFNSEGTVTALLKREGDPVKTGEVIAALDDATYRASAALAQAAAWTPPRPSSTNC